MNTLLHTRLITLRVCFILYRLSHDKILRVQIQLLHMHIRAHAHKGTLTNTRIHFTQNIYLTLNK